MCCGQLLRSVAADGSTLGEEIQPYLDDGRPGNHIGTSAGPSLHDQWQQSEREAACPLCGETGGKVQLIPAMQPRVPHVT